MFNIEGDFMGMGTDFMDMGMSSNVPVEMENDPGRPERPFPLRPGTGIFKRISLDDEFPVTDETDFILNHADNISWCHVASEILNVQVEGDFYGR